MAERKAGQVGKVSLSVVPVRRLPDTQCTPGTVVSMCVTATRAARGAVTQ